MISLNLEECIKQHRFKEMFIDDLGWDNFSSTQELEIQDRCIRLESVAEKRGLRVFSCKLHRTSLANRGLLRCIQRQVIRQHHEHIIVYHSDEPQKQVWQWAIHQVDGRKVRHREHPFLSYQPPRPLLERISNLRFTLDDEENATIVDAMERTRRALDVIPEQEMFARFPSFAKRSDELAVAMRAGEPGAFDRFCEYHLKLARKSSRMLVRWFGMEEDDAFQIASIGIIRAARIFDPTRGFLFSTIASYWIRNCCQRFGLDSAYPVRFPSHLFWPLYKLQFAERRLLATFGNSEARERLSKKCVEDGISHRNWVTFERVKNRKNFSELEVDEWESLSSIKESSLSPCESLLLKEFQQLVRAGIARLSEREQTVLKNRYGIGCKEHTLEEVAGIFGLTRERIRQIQARAEEKLSIFLVKLNSYTDSEGPLDLVPAVAETGEKSEVFCEAQSTITSHVKSEEEPIALIPEHGQGLNCFHTTLREANRMTTWIFSPLLAASVRRDPNETELFKTEQAGEGEYAGTDALVREVIQNSLDAGHREEPVRVRFALHSNSELPAKERLAHYFSRLEPALEFREIGFSEGLPELPNGFLVCEDFGTSGLAGDPNLITDPPKGLKERQDFFWFWRNIGRSGKTGDDLGRWGLGKTVYRAASRVGCMFGLTVRKIDNRELLMGQAVLKIHRHQDREYAPEGFWCSGAGNAGTPLAIEDANELQKFRREWKLTRNQESGLSVVVPYVADELRAESLLRLVVVNFFLPIIKGELVVDVSGPAPAGQRQEWRVDSTTIVSICDELKWNGKVTLKLASAPPIRFAKDCLKEIPNCHVTKLLGETRLPTLDESSFDTESLDIIRRKYLAEEIVAVRVKSLLPRRSGSSEPGELLAFLQRTSTSDRYESYYVREGMTITKLNTKRSVRGVRGLVVVEPGALASLLGDTEGPAHTTWDTSNDERPNRVWKTWKGRVAFFSNILDSLNELLTPKSSAPDFDLLSDFFSIDKTLAPQLNKRPKKPGEPGDKPPFTPPPSTPRWYRLNGKPGGFIIADSGSPPTEVGSVLRVSVAYDLPSGNPLKAWSKFDFDFKEKNSRLQFTGNGVNVKARAGNIMDIEVVKPDFQVTATGFDINRDLFVRIDETNGEEENGDA